MRNNRRFMKTVSALFAATALLAAPSWAAPQAPDNTKVNKQDQPTADQARNGKTDRQLMADIRKSIVDDKSLSTYGHNVKIIAQHGKVTLKGPVHTEDEKKTIESRAAQLAGDGNVSSEITVKGDSK
jgi:hyperosmotically inducible protein